MASLAWAGRSTGTSSRTSTSSASDRRDGTFSVVPQMKGGVTSPEQLRKIADVAEKYSIPMIKATGGQRLDLLGVKKEDLIGVWQDLGMPCGHAYAKALRTVKTCVGSEFCRFGTQDSTGLGIALEQRLWGSWTPHKVKLGVSGCPRNCAEATCKGSRCRGGVDAVTADSGRGGRGYRRARRQPRGRTAMRWERACTGRRSAVTGATRRRPA